MGCVAISTKSSVREMIAPGAYAILAPLFVGFLVGPRCLVGMLAGGIGSGAMVAIMMSNAGGAWDNAKKYCEKDGTKGLSKVKNADGSLAHPMKKTWYDACVVGDTVGDPFKDTSGPALNILIKLMSMVALTIAPLLREKKEVVKGAPKYSEGNDDWENWGWGMIPLGLCILITAVLIFKQILTWKDPLANAQAPNPPAAAEAAKPEPAKEAEKPVKEDGEVAYI